MCTNQLKSTTGLWVIRSWTFLLLSVAFSLAAHAQTVSGRVTGEGSDEGLPGVTVLIEGSTTGTVTDIEGNYRLEAESGATLVFSFVGFEPQKVVVGNQSSIDVFLKNDVQALEEVVVIGYGRQRKEAVTGSVVSIDADAITEIPSPNVTQALQGRLAGVEMSQANSKPGASLQIRIRGTRSLSATNDPLIVLDGIPFAGSIGDINPNDVKSIDILKDASSTAIYGSRGANGVILITTHKGRKGQKPQISYNSFFGIKEVFAKYPMMDGPDFVRLREEAGVYQTNGADEFNDVNTDWQDLFYEPAAMTSHDISVSGGTEGGGYNFGIGYFKDEAVIPIQDYRRFSLRASLDQDIGEYIRVGFTSNNNYAITNGDGFGMYSVLSTSPIVDPYNADGTFKRSISMPQDDEWVRTRETVEALGDSYIDQSRSFGSYNSLYAVVKVPGIDGLSYRINSGLNYRQGNGGSYTGKGVFNVNEQTVSSATVSNSHTTSWTVENLLTYDRTIAGKHNINITGLYSAQEDSYNRSHMTARDVPSDAFQFYNLGQAAQQPVIDPEEQKYTVSGLTSLMGRVMYSYDDRYMIQASYRFDGSSRLADGHKWVSYPAVSAGWNIHREAFMSGISVINKLKFRAGYGITSNQSIDPYSTLGLLSTSPYNFGSNFTTGYFVSSLPNDNLGWEYTESFNYALEFGLLEGRLTGTAEYYNTQTNDLLFTLGLPATSGVDSYVANIGSSENKGFELSLNGLVLESNDGFSWEVGANFYVNRNELTQLASGLDRDEGNWWFVGHPIDVIYDYEAIGLWQAEDENLELYEPGGNVGMIKVKYTGELNEDGTPAREIGPEDRQIMSMQPDFQGGFNTRLAYKGFDLSVVGIFKSGGLLIATPYGSNGYLNILTGRRGNIDVDYWTPENTGAKYPKPGGIGGDSPRYLNSLSYFDASFTKIRTITMGYNFDQLGWIQDRGISRLRLYFTLQNPFVFFSPYHKESGMDPETNSYANENSAVGIGNDDARSRLLTIGTNTPSTRNYVFGLNLTF